MDINVKINRYYKFTRIFILMHISITEYLKQTIDFATLILSGRLFHNSENFTWSDSSPALSFRQRELVI